MIIGQLKLLEHLEALEASFEVAWPGPWPRARVLRINLSLTDAPSLHKFLPHIRWNMVLDIVKTPTAQ